MKQINEYLSTKVKINDGFPKKPIESQIIAALESHGYQKIKVDTEVNSEAIKQVSNSDDPVYTVIKSYDYNLSIIMFFNGGTLSKDNQVYYVYANEEGTERDLKNILPCIGGIKYGINWNEQTSIDTYDEVYDTFNNYLCWTK